MPDHPAVSKAPLKNTGRVLSQKPFAWQQVPTGERPPGWEKVHNYVHPGTYTLRLAIFWASSVTEADDPIPGYFNEAKRLLNAHGLNLQAYPATQKHPSTTLQFSDEVYLHDQVLELRHKAHEAFGGDEYPRLPVIVCPFRQSLVSGEIATGMAVKDRPNAPSNWLPFVLINSQIKSLDSVTLLHEIGHAAGLGHEGEVKKEHAVINFMQYFDPKSTDLSGRDGLSPHQVKTLAKAYFAAPK